MLPLPPMPRTTQRSLKVFDESGNELPVIPSYQVHDALMELSKDYLAGILNHVEIGRDMQEEIEILKNSFDEIFKYGNVEERINEVEIILIHIRQYVDTLNKEARTECEKLLGWLTYLIDIQRHYTPFVGLKETFPSKTYRKIDYKIERPSTLEKTLLFRMKGHIRHLFALKSGLFTSFHLEIIPPDGVDIYNFEFNDLDNTQILVNKREKDNYFDEGLLYVSFSPEETREIHEK